LLLIEVEVLIAALLCHPPTVFCRHPDVTLESELVPHTNIDEKFSSAAGFQNSKMKKISFTILICLLVMNATAQNQ